MHCVYLALWTHKVLCGFFFFLCAIYKCSFITLTVKRHHVLRTDILPLCAPVISCLCVRLWSLGGGWGVEGRGGGGREYKLQTCLCSNVFFCPYVDTLYNICVFGTLFPFILEDFQGFEEITITVKTWSRSEYSYACFAYCQEFLIPVHSTTCSPDPLSSTVFFPCKYVK